MEAVDEVVMRQLAHKGVLLSDEDDPELDELRSRHETLESLGWKLEAALYYFLSKWRGIDLRRLAGQDETSDLLPPTDEAVRAFVTRFGPPPSAFASAEAPLAVRELPLVSARANFTTYSCGVGRHAASTDRRRSRCGSSRLSSATSSGTTGSSR